MRLLQALVRQDRDLAEGVGIRTHETVTRLVVFKTTSLSLSDTPPIHRRIIAPLPAPTDVGSGGEARGRRRERWRCTPSRSKNRRAARRPARARCRRRCWRAFGCSTRGLSLSSMRRWRRPGWPSRSRCATCTGGILQIGVGFYHLERQNFRGARNLLTYGMDRLAPFEPACRGVDVRGLRAAALRCRDELERLGRDRIGEFDTGLIPLVRVDDRVPRLRPSRAGRRLRMRQLDRRAKRPCHNACG